MSTASKQWHSLPAIVLHLELEMENRFRLPPFAGSLFRGCLGWALKNLCIAQDYELLFEPKRKHIEASRPFVLVPPLAERDLKPGDRLRLTLKLFGYGCQHVTTFLDAFHKIGRYGIGQSRSRFRVTRVIADEARGHWVVHDRCAGGQLYAPLPLALRSFTQHSIGQCQCIEVQFLTPTRLVDHGRPNNSPDVRLILRAAYRRLRGLLEMNGHDTESWDYRASIEDAARQIQTTASSLSWSDWERRSNRQKRTIVMGGLSGSIRLEGHFDAKLIELFRAAELLHLGKATTFGMGQVSFRPVVLNHISAVPPSIKKRQLKDTADVTSPVT